MFSLTACILKMRKKLFIMMSVRPFLYRFSLKLTITIEIEVEKILLQISDLIFFFSCKNNFVKSLFTFVYIMCAFNDSAGPIKC